MTLTAIILGVLAVILYLKCNWWRSLCLSQQETIDWYERLTRKQHEALKRYHEARPVKVLKCAGSPDIHVEHAESAVFITYETGSFN